MGGIIGWNAAARAMAPPPATASGASETHAKPYISRLLLNDVGPLLNPVALQRILKYVTFELKTATQQQMGEILRTTYAPFGPQRDAWYERMLRVQTRRLPDGMWTTHFDPRVMRALLFNNPVADVVVAEMDAASPVGAPPSDGTFDTRHWAGDAVAASGAAADEALVPWAAFDAVRAPILLVHGADSDLLQPAGVNAMLRRKTAQRGACADDSSPEYKLETYVVAGVGHAPTLNDDVQIERVVEFLFSPGL
jgi:pimeloyl-ACP methyl ester carboxylesterase